MKKIHEMLKTKYLPMHLICPITYKHMHFHLLKVRYYFKIVLPHLKLRIRCFASIDISITLWKHDHCRTPANINGNQRHWMLHKHTNISLYSHPYSLIETLWTRRKLFLSLKQRFWTRFQTHLPCCCVQTRNHL